MTPTIDKEPTKNPEFKIPGEHFINYELCFLKTAKYDEMHIIITEKYIIAVGLIPFMIYVTNGVRTGFIRKANEPIIVPFSSIALK